MTCVTFIVPIFNKARYLPAVLQAIFDQEGDFDREIIAIDDGSTDESGQILKSYQEQHKNLRLIRLEDEGPAIAINRAAAEATGDYFKFVDGDDLLVSNAAALLLDAIRETGAVLAYGERAVYDSELLPNITTTPASELRPSLIDEPLPFLIHNISLTMSGSMVDANAFRLVGGCDERVFVHDSPLFLRLALAGKFAHIASKVFYMPLEDPSRWSNRALGQVLHDVNAAIYYMLLDNPGLPWKLKNKSMQRAASRAWTWARRENGASPLSRWYALNLIARLPLLSGQAAMVARSLESFRKSGHIRLPAKN